MTDIEILNRVCKRADEESFQEFIGRYQDLVYKRSYMFCLGNKDEAEQLAISIFVEMWNKILKNEYTEPINRWVTGITMRIGYEHYKKLNKN